MHQFVFESECVNVFREVEWESMRGGTRKGVEAIAALEAVLRFAAAEGLPIDVIARQAELSRDYVRKILRGSPDLFEKAGRVVNGAPCWRLRSSQDN